MALIGSINNWGEIQGQINDANGVLTGVISSAELVGGQIVGMRGLKGDKGDTGDTGATGADGQDGADGFSPSASVSKVGDTTTITITDKDGTTTASVYDGKDDVFIAEYGVTTYDEIDDAFIDGKAIILKWQSAGYYRYFPCSVIDTSSSYKLTFLMGKSIAYDVEVKPLTPPLDWRYSSRNLQETLVSGTSIKTINNESLLGSGNIDIQGGGASAFIAEYGVTSYSDVKDAYDEDAIILCKSDDSGNTAILQLAYFDDANDMFYFAQPNGDGWLWASIAIDDTWGDGSFQFANTDTATQLRNGLMDALDKQKLDGITSGAEVNVQSDWNEADSTDDAYIKNKPTIPPKNVWYGTCSTSSSVQQKSVTTSSGDFALDEGNILLVEFASTNTYDGATLSVDELTAKAIYVNGSPTNDHRWRAGEVVIFVYDGYYFNLVEQGTATTSYYGITKLSSSTSSTSEALAATPKAVKAAYDEATDATATPTASKKSKFDSSAHMNSTDMTTGADSELEDFIDGLNVSGGGVVKTNVTPTSGTNYSGYGNCYYEVLGKLVHFHIGIGNLAANTTTKIYTMPSGLRPQTKIFAKGSGGTSLNYSGIEIGDNGEIYVTSQGTYCGAELWYFV